MRVKAITPIRVSPEELERRRRRYERLSPSGVHVELVNLPEDAPGRLESAADVKRSSRLVAQAIGPGEGFDAVLPDCVLDPGIESEEGASVPIFGMLRLSAGHLAALGLPFAHVTRNEAIRDELERRLEQYGLASLRTGHGVLCLDFEAIADGGRWNAVLTEEAARLARGGARAVINGCSAVEVSVPGAIPIVDPAALALELLGAAGRSGLVASPDAVPA